MVTDCYFVSTHLKPLASDTHTHVCLTVFIQFIYFTECMAVFYTNVKCKQFMSQQFIFDINTVLMTRNYPRQASRHF